MQLRSEAKPQCCHGMTPLPPPCAFKPGGGGSVREASMVPPLHSQTGLGDRGEGLGHLDATLTYSPIETWSVVGLAGCILIVCQLWPEFSPQAIVMCPLASRSLTVLAVSLIVLSRADGQIAAFCLLVCGFQGPAEDELRMLLERLLFLTKVRVVPVHRRHLDSTTFHHPGQPSFPRHQEEFGPCVMPPSLVWAGAVHSSCLCD